jgi:hypothetical protein
MVITRSSKRSFDDTEEEETPSVTKYLNGSKSSEDKIEK